MQITNVGGSIGDKDKTKLTERQEGILNLTQENAHVSANEMSEILSVTQRIYHWRRKKLMNMLQKLSFQIASGLVSHQCHLILEAYKKCVRSGQKIIVLTNR